MPATKFICPTEQQVPITRCLESCIMRERCMFLPTLRAVAKSLDRGLPEATVTELMSGTREVYLKKSSNYAVDPQAALYALHGQSFHNINENNTDGDILSEIRLQDQVTSGKFDLYGKIIDNTDGVLGDLKVTSSYKLAKALGIYKVDVPTGDVYKTGEKKGQPKYRNELRYDGVRHILDWAIQINYYRMLLEEQGFEVKRMYIQALCRDYNLRIATERGITLFSVPTDDPENPDMIKEFSAVILYHHPMRAYYKGKYTGGNNPPDCGSFDCVTGHGNPGGLCCDF